MIEMRACVRPWCEIARRHTSASTRASLRGGCAPTAPRRASRVNTRQAILTCSAQRAPIGLSRRAAVTLSSAALSAGLLASRAHAQPPEVLAQGTVVLPSGAEQGLPTDQAALYLTIREPLNRLLPGSSSPPLASLRVAASQLTFPYAFAITASDLYPEFQHQPAGWLDGKSLVVSARLDMDGTALTRDPDDLVGRGTAAWGQTSRAEAVVQLTGRGAGGKLVTRKQQPSS